MPFTLLKSATFVRADTPGASTPGDVGDGWVDEKGSTWQIENNLLRAISFSNTDWAQNPPIGACLRPVGETFRNGKVELYNGSVLGGGDAQIVALRYMDANNFYYALRTADSTRIAKVVAGNTTVMVDDSPAIHPSGAVGTITQVVIDENDITLNVFSAVGALLYTITRTDGASSHNLAGRYGILHLNITVMSRIDGFSADIPITITPIAGVIGYVGDQITAGNSPTNAAAALNAVNLSGPTYVPINVGTAGTTSDDWTDPDGDTYSDAINTLADNGAGTISIMLGTNDSKTGNAVSKSTYKANILALITLLLDAGATRIILNKPMWVEPGGAWNSNSNLLIDDYGDALDELATADPTHVFMGDTLAFPYFEIHQAAETSDGVVPNTTGAVSLGDFWADAYVGNFPSGFLPIPAITSGLTASGIRSVAITAYQIEGTNTPTSYDATGLPPGLSVNTVTGLITGTPTTHGVFNVTISAINAAGPGTATLVFSVALYPTPLTVFHSALTAMRAQIEGEILGDGVVCDIQRFTPTTDATGRKSGTWVSLVSGGVYETIWIQPYSVNKESSDVAPQGLNAETTHIGFQVHNGTAVIPKDRIVASGGTYVYDVVESQTHETHKEIMLKQVRRT